MNVYNTMKLTGFLLYVAIFFLIIFFGLRVQEDYYDESYLHNITSYLCCNLTAGGYCTDVYLDDDGLCHLTMCESLISFDKNNCTYKPINKLVAKQVIQ